MIQIKSKMQGHDVGKPGVYTRKSLFRESIGGKMIKLAATFQNLFEFSIIPIILKTLWKNESLDNWDIIAINKNNYFQVANNIYAVNQKIKVISKIFLKIKLSVNEIFKVLR